MRGLKPDICGRKVGRGEEVVLTKQEKNSFFTSEVSASVLNFSLIKQFSPQFPINQGSSTHHLSTVFHSEHKRTSLGMIQQVILAKS